MDRGHASELEHRIYAAARMLEVDRATAEVTSALASAGIPSILLKGPAIARWLYTDEFERSYLDCDLLVSGDKMHDAEDVLGSLGFRRRGFESIVDDRFKYAVPLGREDGTAIDLHQTFVGVGAEPSAVWDELSRRVQPMTVAGVEVSVLMPSARAFALALHAAKDAHKSPKTRGDLERAIEVVPLQVWEDARSIAQRLDAIPAFAGGLRRTQRGVRLASELGLPERVSPDVALRDTTPPPLAVGIDWLVRSKGARAKARVVAHKLFPPAEHLRAWSPLARRGRLGLVAAYVARPFWVMGRAGPATIAVWDAHRRAARSRAGPPRPHKHAPPTDRRPLRELSLSSKSLLAARIWWSFLSTWIAVKRRPLPDVVDGYANAPARRRRSLHPRRLGTIVWRVLAIGPWRARCLFLALVLFRLLREEGERPVLVIGMPREPRDKDAHAWVELDGVDVGPPPGGAGHQVLARFP